MFIIILGTSLAVILTGVMAWALATRNKLNPAIPNRVKNINNFFISGVVNYLKKKRTMASMLEARAIIAIATLVQRKIL
jgi:hypothetical protein